MEKEEKFCRRKDDLVINKLSKLAGIITAVAVILGALSLVGATVFAKKEDLKDLDIRVQTVEKDQVRVLTKLDDIQSTVQEIKEAVKAK